MQEITWWIFFIISASLLTGSIIWAIVRSKTKYVVGRFLDSTKILFFGIILSAFVLFIPIYCVEFKENQCGIFETVLMSVHNIIRLFIVDGEFGFVTDNIESLTGVIYYCYSWLFSVLFVSAPILTFGFVLSFFKNISAYKRYITHFKTDMYIFSELSDKSLALATSLYENDHKNRCFVFTDVFEKNEEKSFELIERAKEIDAILFKKDVISIDFSFHSKDSHINFFTIGEDYSENITQSLKIIEDFKYRKNTNLYVFSVHVESEILLANAFNDEENKNSGEKEIEIKVRRVNEVRSLVYRTLYETGYEKIFENAVEDERGMKHINAVIIGMGQYGTEMTKALSWFCQMDGYEARINAFDSDKLAESKFKSLCPELMSDKLNGSFDSKGETRYEINIHPNQDVDSFDFDTKLSSLPPATYVLVALGNDEKNISVAIKLRMLYSRWGIEPIIQAIVYDSEKGAALHEIKNFKRQPYDIDFIGDMKTSYSEEVILDSDVEADALSRHMKWGNENDFWRYDYNYKSSVASAIHAKMKRKCGIPGSDKLPGERSEEELWGLRILEHRRWNAYMRSEGYVYSGSQDKKTRNDLAKMHHCLVPFEDLPLEEQIKDDD